MSIYISSNDNRFYTAIESEYGRVPAVSAACRIPAVQLSTKQTAEVAERKDKTGTRTFLGIPAGTRKRTTFDLRTYLTTWADAGKPPAYGPLFQAAMGSAPLMWPGATVAASLSPTRLQFSGAHGLIGGQAIAVGGEIRFVSALVDDSTVELNAPFTLTPTAGDIATATVTYAPGKTLGSVSVFDRWSPATSVQRIVNGAAVDKMSFGLNGDFHEFRFRGGARDVIDNVSFTEGEGGMSEFPAEPEIDAFDLSIVPGHLGQIWMGSEPGQFLSVTAAELTLDNDVELRTREFGLEGARCVVPGRRSVSFDVELYAADDEQTTALYNAARQRSPVPVMLQMGDMPGQIFGAYMKALLPSVPSFDDGESRLKWKFAGSRAQGMIEDELVVAFA